MCDTELLFSAFTYTVGFWFVNRKETGRGEGKRERKRKKRARGKRYSVLSSNKLSSLKSAVVLNM